MLEKHFPILKRQVNGQKLVYLDNASTTQKPESVIRAISDFYELHNANIHRGIHTLSVEATQAYESARDKVQKFINAKHREEIIFTHGATEAINLVGATWGEHRVKRGDEILLTEMEHHSNLVPWQALARKKEAQIRYIPVHNSPNPSYLKRGTRNGELDLSKLDKLINKKTKIVSVVHISNTLDIVNPIEKITRAAHKKGAKVLIDGAQAGGHLKIDVQKLDCGFYVLSGHKMYGPTGVGVLYGKKELLEKMPPYQTGGHMIKRVEWRGSTWNDLPYKFEAGTANIADVIGLGAAVDFINAIGIERIRNYELGIMEYALRKLQTIPGIVIYGPRERGPVISFNIKGIPPHDLASILDERGIAIRAGHQCTMPLHKKLGIAASARASFAIYNARADIDKLIIGIKSAIKTFGL